MRRWKGITWWFLGREGRTEACRYLKREKKGLSAMLKYSLDYV